MNNKLSKEVKKKCKHTNTEAIFDPLNTFYGISYVCKDCEKYLKGDELLK